MSFRMRLSLLLDNLEFGFSRGFTAFTNAAEVAGMVFSRCKEMHLNPVDVILNCVNSTILADSTVRYFSALDLFDELNLTSDPRLDIYAFHNALAWETNYEEAIVTVSSLTKKSTSEQRELLATRGSFTAYLLLFMADKGIRLDRKSAWHQGKYNDILTSYFKTLSNSSLESQLHLFAGMFPAEKVNAWLDFLDESKDTTWTPGAVGTEAGGNNEDLYFNTPKRMIDDALSDIGNIISELKFSKDSYEENAENTLLREKLLEAMAKVD
jgi:hypothetical protein